jgi:hypothetical protein
MHVHNRLEGHLEMTTFRGHRSGGLITLALLAAACSTASGVVAASRDSGATTTSAAATDDATAVPVNSATTVAATSAAPKPTTPKSAPPKATTVPKTTTAPKTTTTPAPTSPSGPEFTSFTVSAQLCGPPTTLPGLLPDAKVIVQWKVTGPFDSIYDAVDNVDGPFNQGLPSSGADVFSRDCSAAHTYFVVAVSNGTKTVRSMVIAP